MTQHKHTQGIWRIIKPIGKPQRKICAENGVIVATCHPSKDLKGQHHFKQNARLIAAAPELLAALEGAQKALAMMIAPDAIKQTTVLNAFAAATDAELRAREAITKATGAE